MSARLSAMRKLQDNPYDVQAMNTIYHSQKSVSGPRHRDTTIGHS